MDTTEKALKRIFGVIARGQTYLNLIYVLLAFPLGLFYFVFLVTGLSVGIGLAIVWVGLLILALMLGAWWLFILFERQLATGLLQVKLDPLETPKTKDAQTTWKKIGAYLSNPVTWKGLLYLFLKFPLGIILFVLVVTFVSVTLSFLAAPLFYSFGYFPEIWFTASTYWQINSLGEAMILSVAGIPMIFITLHLVNGLAWISGWLAKVLLGNPVSKVALAVEPVAQSTAAPKETVLTPAGDAKIEG